jgi:hypothetical protein
LKQIFPARTVEVLLCFTTPEMKIVRRKNETY